METISYNKIKKKKKSSALVIAYSNFLILGTMVIFYFTLVNEPIPKTIGSDPAKVAEQQASVKLENESKNQLVVKVETKNEKDTSAKRVVADINFPVVKIGDTDYTKLNEEIGMNTRTIFGKLKSEMDGNVNNTYEFTSIFRNFENIVGENQVLSVIVTDKMLETISKNVTYLKATSYNINLKTMEKINSYDVATELYGADSKEYVQDTITAALIDKGIKTKDDESYIYTGLENFYVEAGEMHIVLNKTDIGTEKYEVVDVKIMKK